MDKKELGSLRKNELITEYQKLQRKYNKLNKQLEQVLVENKRLSSIRDESKKWSVNNVIPMDKIKYSEDEKKQVLAWSEGYEKKYLETAENHDNYFILKDGEWYEIKTFEEILKSDDFNNLDTILELLRASNPSEHLYTKDDYLMAFNKSKKTDKKRVLKAIIKKMEEEGLPHKIEVEEKFETEMYYESFQLFINTFLDFYTEPLGNYNLYKIHVDKESIEDYDAARKANINYFFNEYPAEFTQDNGCDNTED